jgi:hypothetical protein
MDYKLDGWVLSLVGARFFCSPQLALGPTQTPIQQVLGVNFPGVKWMGPEADHSPPSNAEVNNVLMA